LITIEPVDYAEDEVRALRTAMAAELDGRYPGLPPGYGGVQKATPEQFRTGRGLYVLARDDGTPIGIAAVRLVDEETAEIKNVYVDPAWRGRGVGGLLMEPLEAWARDAGVARLILETGEEQPEALALYMRLGYARIPCYPPWDDALSVCMEKRLGDGLSTQK
jgi:GNAT superfamily N-acetyltransferase